MLDPQPVVAHEAPKLVKLDLACGQRPREGFRGVDKYALGEIEHVDLLQFPWPWANDSVDELHCSHFLEHIPARETEERDVDAGTYTPPWLGKDLLCTFMDQCWRILKPGGLFTVVVPSARSNRGFQDPTHRRFFVAETFLYFNKAWRESQGLQHYLGICDFEVQVDPIIPIALTVLTPEAQQRRFNEHWNTVLDFQARLTCRK